MKKFDQDEYDSTPIEYYLVGYGHSELLDVFNKRFDSVTGAMKYAKEQYYDEIEYQMELHDESRKEAKKDTFHFYVAEKRKGYTELWLYEIDPLNGRWYYCYTI